MFYSNPDWDSMPWHHLNHPMERVLVLPSFVIGEFYFIFLALVTLVHALAHGRTHIMVWVASLAAGTANDAIFMFLPFVDNFWQAQVRAAPPSSADRLVAGVHHADPPHAALHPLCVHRVHVHQHRGLLEAGPAPPGLGLPDR